MDEASQRRKEDAAAHALQSAVMHRSGCLKAALRTESVLDVSFKCRRQLHLRIFELWWSVRHCAHTQTTLPTFDGSRVCFLVVSMSPNPILALMANTNMCSMA